MPIEIVSSQLFTLFAFILIIESIKTLFLGSFAAANRGKVKQFLNEEDAVWLGGEAITVDHPVAGRFFRAQRNNIENLLPFFLVGWVYLTVDANFLTGLIYFSLFFLARIGHTFAYLSKRALLRRNTYTLAWLMQIVTGVHAGVVVGLNSIQ